MLALGRKAVGSSTETPVAFIYVTSTGGIWSNRVPGDLPDALKFQGPMPFKSGCPREHADMAKNIARRPVSLKAKGSWIIDGRTR